MELKAPKSLNNRKMRMNFKKSQKNPVNIKFKLNKNKKKKKQNKKLSSKIKDLRKSTKTTNSITTDKKLIIKTFNQTNHQTGLITSIRTETITIVQKINFRKNNTLIKISQLISKEHNSKKLAEIKSYSIKNKRNINTETTKIINLKVEKNKLKKEAIPNINLPNKWLIHLGKLSNHSNNKSLSNHSKEKKSYSDFYLLFTHLFSFLRILLILVHKKKKEKS